MLIHSSRKAVQPTFLALAVVPAPLWNSHRPTLVNWCRHDFRGPLGQLLPLQQGHHIPPAHGTSVAIANGIAWGSDWGAGAVTITFAWHSSAASSRAGKQPDVRRLARNLSVCMDGFVYLRGQDELPSECQLCHLLPQLAPSVSELAFGAS